MRWVWRFSMTNLLNTLHLTRSECALLRYHGISSLLGELVRFAVNCKIRRGCFRFADTLEDSR